MNKNGEDVGGVNVGWWRWKEIKWSSNVEEKCRCRRKGTEVEEENRVWREKTG